MGRLRDEQDAYGRFETAEGWRRADLVRLLHRLDHHWAEVVAACVGADDPLAYGIGQPPPRPQHPGRRETGR